MRLFSEENRTGTLELLLTKPITEFKLVFSKFIAGLILVVISLLPTLIYYISIGEMGAESWNIDSASTWGGYIGLLLLGGVFVSIGLFTSSISKNQVVAFMLAMVLCFIFYLGFGFIAGFFDSPIDLLFLNLGIAEHYSSIQRGVIDSRDIIYYISLMIFFLYATKLVLQSRKW
jgi:ABC-2 type transport system permease protein